MKQIYFQTDLTLVRLGFEVHLGVVSQVTWISKSLSQKIGIYLFMAQAIEHSNFVWRLYQCLFY